jgi:ADP-ribose pyrophosphatase YjhB (NUDIX family)
MLDVAPTPIWITYPKGKIPTDTCCPHCARYNTRSVCANTLAIKDNQVLLILRKTDPEAGAWALPGGYINWDETAEQAAVRECLEESGYHFVLDKLLKLYSDPHREKDGRQNIVALYVGTVTESTIEPTDGEAADVRWFDFNHLPEKIAFDHRGAINDYLKERES